MRSPPSPLPNPLDLLDLQGCIVTIDAMGCQREIAQIIGSGGSWTWRGRLPLAVKENQGVNSTRASETCSRGTEALGFDGVP